MRVFRTIWPGLLLIALVWLAVLALKASIPSDRKLARLIAVQAPPGSHRTEVVTFLKQRGIRHDIFNGDVSADISVRALHGRYVAAYFYFDQQGRCKQVVVNEFDPEDESNYTSGFVLEPGKGIQPYHEEPTPARSLPPVSPDGR